MTVAKRLFGEDPGCSGPAKELPRLRPLADLEKVVTGRDRSFGLPRATHSALWHSLPNWPGPVVRGPGLWGRAR
jgi:hypothetical protein